LAAFAPQDAEAVGALREVIRRFHTLDVEKHSQRLSFLCQTPSQRPGFILPGSVLVDQ
jgi:hypothetical protein